MVLTQLDYKATYLNGLLSEHYMKFNVITDKKKKKEKKYATENKL